MCRFVFLPLCGTNIMMSKKGQINIVSLLIVNSFWMIKRYLRYIFGACLWELDPVCLNQISFCKIFASLPAWNIEVCYKLNQYIHPMCAFFMQGFETARSDSCRSPEEDHEQPSRNEGAAGKRDGAIVTSLDCHFIEWMFLHFVNKPWDLF